MYWHYDCRPDDNRFNINDLYRRLPKKPFIKGNKKRLEAVMMYSWINEVGTGEKEYWKEYCDEFDRTQE